jgi:hypothetical protein
MTDKVYKVFFLFLFCIFFAAAAFTQNSNSSIKGTIKDVSGAVVPSATIVLTDIGTAQQRTTTTSTDGFYNFVDLAPANYKLSVTAPGFATWIGVLTLRVSQAALVDATLNAASVSTQVTVRDVTPIIDSVNPTISDVKNATAIETIPVSNRSILNVLAFSPGVVAGGYGGSGAGYTRVNGIQGGSVDFLVDGQTMTTRWTNDLQQNAQSTMTFQELKVITANGDAQYNRPGIVELVTKSGTNQFHGQAFELNQNNHLQARTFNSGPQIPFLQHNEYGGQLGGPVWIPKVYNGKDKTFFFVDFEWIKQNSNAIQRYIVPTQAQRQGDLSTVLAGGTGDPLQIYDPNSTTVDPITGAYDRTPFVGNIIPPNRLNPVTQKIFGITAVAGLAPLALPNITNPNIWQYTPNYIPAAASQTIDNKLYTAKVDQVFGPNRLAARYSYTESDQITPLSYAPEDPDESTVGGSSGSLTFTEVIGPKAINVAHVGVTYNHAFRGPIPIPNVPALLGLPTYSDTVAWPSFYWSYSNGVASTNDNYWVGIDRDNPQDYPNSTITGSDQFSYNRGNHQLLFGFDVNNTRITTYEIGQPGGGYGFGGNFTALQSVTGVTTPPPNGPIYDTATPNTGMGLADFLLGDSDGLFQNIYPHYHTRQTEYDGYAQDNWRVTQNLTVNLGLRYEYWTAFSDASGLYSTFDPNIPGGMVVYQGSGQPAQTPPAVLASFIAAGLPIESAAAAHYPLSLFTMPWANFEPRIGFAYQLNSKTVLRGGWGIYQWVIPLQQFQQASRKNPPFSYSASVVPGEVNGVSTDESAAIMEFPIASASYGGPQGVNQFMLGSQGCTNQPAGTCTPPGLELNTSSVDITQGGGFGIAPLSPNYKPSTVQEYNLSLARELPWHTGVQLSYIGNHSYNLLQTDPINYIIPRAQCTAAEGGVLCAPNQRRPFAVFTTSGPGNYDLYEYDGYANSNELQAQVQHTFGNGLLVQSYFTWGRFLTTTESGLLGGGAPGGQVATQDIIPAALTPGYTTANYASGAPLADRIRAVYSNDPTLPTKTFQFNAHYQLPFGKGQRYVGNAHGVLNALVSGYNVSAFFLWHSGFWFAPYATQYQSGTVFAAGGRGIFLAPGKTGILPKGQRTVNHWFDYQSPWDPLSGNPYAGQTYELTQTSLQGDYRNNIPFNYMTGPGFNNMDANVYKLTPLWRNLVFDFEAQVFNIYNHQNLGMPNSTGIINASIGTPRTIQLQAKFVF